MLSSFVLQGRSRSDGALSPLVSLYMLYMLAAQVQLGLFQESALPQATFHEVWLKLLGVFGGVIDLILLFICLFIYVFNCLYVVKRSFRGIVAMASTRSHFGFRAEHVGTQPCHPRVF